MATLITSASELSKALDNAKQKLVLVNVSATWCRPCQMIAPAFDAMASRHSQKCVLLRIYADKNPDAAQSYNVSGYPTFIFIHNKNEIERFSGADESKLESTIQSLAERYARTFMSGTGAGTAGGDDDDDMAEIERQFHAERAAAGLPPKRFNPWVDAKFRQRALQQAKSPGSTGSSGAAGASSSGGATAAAGASSGAAGASDAAPTTSSSGANGASAQSSSQATLTPEQTSLKSQLQEMGFPEANCIAAATRCRNLEDALTWITDPANEGVTTPAPTSGSGSGVPAAAAKPTPKPAAGGSEEMSDFALMRSVMSEMDNKRANPGARTSLSDLAAIQKARAAGVTPPTRTTPPAAAEKPSEPKPEAKTETKTEQPAPTPVQRRNPADILSARAHHVSVAKSNQTGAVEQITDFIRSWTRSMGTGRVIFVLVIMIWALHAWRYTSRERGLQQQ